MPAKSKQQQKFMGIVRAIQKGDAPASKFSKDARDAAKDMSKSDVKKFAKTKHKGLPRKVKQELLNRLKKEYAFYHTGTFARKRKHDDDNNLGRKKKHSGQPDIEEGMVKPARGHEFFQLTKDVELDYISGHSGIGLKVPGVHLHNVVSQFKGKKGAYIINYFGRHAYVDMKKRQQMDILPIGNKYQKKLRWNSNYKTVDMAPDYSDWKNFKKPVKENVVKNHDGKAAPYGSGYEKVDEDGKKISDKNYADYKKNNKEDAVNEIGIFPITNYLSGIIPKGRLDVITKQDREKAIALIKDLVYTLNDFWKSHKIPFRVREPRKSDMEKFKKKTKRI